MWLNPQEIVDFLTFTEDIFNGKPHFLCRVIEHKFADLANKNNSWHLTTDYQKKKKKKKERIKEDSKHFCKHLPGILGEFP